MFIPCIFHEATTLPVVKRAPDLTLDRGFFLGSVFLVLVWGDGGVLVKRGSRLGVNLRTIKKAASFEAAFFIIGGPDGTRTRDLRRDRPAF